MVFNGISGTNFLINNMNTIISIIIPTLNEESAIGETLKNLKEIQDVPVEIIVSDGKSTDQTVEICRKMADHVVICSDEGRQTIGGGRNLGAKKASGKYLLFLDADVNIPDPDKFLNTIIKEFESNEKLVAATVKLKVLKDKETLSDKIFSALAINWINYFYNNILSVGSASGEFQFIRRNCFEKLGGFNEQLVAAEDFEMFGRLAKIGKTKIFYDLTAYHTGRRFHQVGWLKILWRWFNNYIHMLFFKKTKSEEWDPIR
jgi:glycosyltransferase involved in cell wall biosynthesis